MGMGVLMKKLLEAFSFKSIQEFARILKIILKAGFTNKDFINFAEAEKEEFSKDFFELKEVVVAGKKEVKIVAARKATGVEKKQYKQKSDRFKFIIPGELEEMAGVVCSKCGSIIYITATCCSNPLKRQGFLRKGICQECGVEFGIR